LVVRSETTSRFVRKLAFPVLPKLPPQS